MKANKPLVSVLIPAYNHEKYIEDTIYSIIDQDYQNIELIIIDDGSTDSTWSKIQGMKETCEKRFKRVYFETKENQGTCLTLNKLLLHSHGEYIYIIASDDCAKSNAISFELNFLINSPDYALCVGDNEFIDAEGKICFWTSDRKNIYDESSATYKSFRSFLEHENDICLLSDEFGTYEKLCSGNHIPNGYLIRKTIFEKTGLFNVEAPLEDYYLMLQISKYAKMKFLPEILFQYRWHGNNTIISSDKIGKYQKELWNYENLINKAAKESIKYYLPNAKKTVLSLEKYIKKNITFQVYFDFGEGFSEKNSIVKKYDLTENNVIKVNPKIQNICNLRIDPADISLCLKINHIKIKTINGESYIGGNSLQTNAFCSIDDSYYFLTMEPSIYLNSVNLSDLQEIETSFAYLSYDKFITAQKEKSDELIKNNNILTNELTECRNEIKSLKDSFIWKLTKPLRYLLNNVRVGKK